MVRAQGDDFLAFAELYGRHVDDALRVAEEICGDHDRAEETVQDGFFSIWRSRAEYRPRLGSFGIWSMRIVHNRAVDSFRVMRGRPRLQAGPRNEDPLEQPDEDPTLAAAVADSERAQMFDALRHLPDRQAEVIVLSFYGDLTLSEIAHRLEIPTGTAKGRMRLGLEKLRADWLLLEGRNVGRVIR